tara:strand:- start:126 stop:428 length:303 start_codon:yes stop_codon:yes gene_type:complete
MKHFYNNGIEILRAFRTNAKSTKKSTNATRHTQKSTRHMENATAAHAAYSQKQLKRLTYIAIVLCLSLILLVLSGCASQKLSNPAEFYDTQEPTIIYNTI